MCSKECIGVNVLKFGETKSDSAELTESEPWSDRLGRKTGSVVDLLPNRSSQLSWTPGRFVKVLRLVDGERLVMGFIYEAMDQAKEQIKATYKDRVANYGPIWEIIG